MFDLKALQDRLGLPEHFLRRAVTTLETILEPHITRGDSNRMLFSDAALPLLEQVARLKNEGASLPEIKARLEKDLASQLSKPAQTGPSVFDLLEENKRLALDKQAVDGELTRIKDSLRALPAGGDVAKLRQLALVMVELEAKTRPRWFQGERVEALWKMAREILDVGDR